MKAVNIPAKFPIPWAQNATTGFIRDIPVTSQIGINDGAASLETGWVPDNFSAGVEGGIAPNGKDDNGIKNQITANIRWWSAGMDPKYDSSFSSSIGGYPKGSVLQKADESGYWISTADDNTTNPDTGGAGWSSMTITKAIDPSATNDSKTPASTDWVNAAIRNINVGFPVGCVCPYLGGYFTNNANGGFTSVLGNTIAAINARYNASGFYVCDGSALNISSSPIYNGTGRYLPNITDSRFIMGSTAAGIIGGDNTMVHTHVFDHYHAIDHTHTYDHYHVTAGIVLSLAQMPYHYHKWGGNNLSGVSPGSGVPGWGSDFGDTGYAGGNSPHDHGATSWASQTTGATTSGPSSGISSWASGGSGATTGNPSYSENRPKFLAALMLQRVF